MSDLILTAKRWLEHFFEGPVEPLVPLQGDASSRQYFRFLHGDKSYILMHADAEKENSFAFIEIARVLRASGLNVPAILDHDLRQGFILMDDLGENLYHMAIKNVDSESLDKLYFEAIDSLLLLNQCESPEEYTLSRFDSGMMIREIGLFEEWFLHKKCNIEPDSNTLDALNKIYNILYESAESQPVVFVHRDYHAGNLLVCPQKPGIIDFQDAVMGPITYDLVSLLLDRYMTWPRDKIEMFVKYYYEHAQDMNLLHSISFPQFLRWFDLMGLQRNLKIVGIFSRLELRDHKLGYLKFMPRFMNHLVDTAKRYSECHVLAEFMENVCIPRFEYIKAGGALA